MELRFTPLRTAVFLLLITIFAFFGGFSAPGILAEAEVSPRNGMRAWLMCVAMFVTGAAFLTIVDHYVGLVHPISLRPVYVILGLVLTVSSFLWISALQDSWKEQLGV